MTAAASVARFGRVQVEMLECVHQHRLLSTVQLHALYRDALSLRRTQRALAAMERIGWLESVRQPGGMKLWFVTEQGADAVESIGNRAELRRKVIPREQAAGPLQQHTLAVNEVGVAFVRAERERSPDDSARCRGATRSRIRSDRGRDGGARRC
ncbi:MAG TPA: replication-relaxation family protein [Conexibacter sp.]|nr:replication-relaxation family protein [Conexibacter sp.]